MLVLLASAGGRHHGFWEVVGGSVVFGVIALAIFIGTFVASAYREKKPKMIKTAQGRVFVRVADFLVSAWRWFKRQNAGVAVAIIATIAYLLIRVFG